MRLVLGMCLQETLRTEKEVWSWTKNDLRVITIKPKLRLWTYWLTVGSEPAEPISQPQPQNEKGVEAPDPDGENQVN
ncbi:2998_t:CDS:2 [Ambispora gerdemannii]|uniref:2998_t:CDS:1 n=1 Tax=Ambispora gerdemannii TaxID=144530 RepID=A0A9N8Z2Z9_9GLOM|nr:2998_t:CDS:2 [Ambispora gerdemannii]